MAFSLYTKKEVVSELATELSCTKKVAQQIIDAVDRLHRDKLIQGKSVLAFGIGTLTLKDFAATNKYVPTKGEVITIPAKKRIKFKQRLKIQ